MIIYDLIIKQRVKNLMFKLHNEDLVHVWKINEKKEIKAKFTLHLVVAEKTITRNLACAFFTTLI